MLNYLLLSIIVCATVCGGQNTRPNIVFIMTDDQDLVLGGMEPMANVQRLIGDEGVTFTNSFVSSPVCCPSRASILSGMYIHNHLSYNNSFTGGCFGESWNQFESQTFGAILQDAGYNTFYGGKYLNQYGTDDAGGTERIPPGWSDWHGLVRNSNYYNYTLSHNGVSEFIEDLYLTDVLRDLSVSFIENQSESQPFLIVLSPPAPHSPFTPAPRHEGVYANVTAVRHPNFNVGYEDKHWLIRMPPTPLPEELMPELDRVFRARWESLLSVDEMVADVVTALEDNSLLDNTYLIFTSDNGYHVGQFSQVYDKRQPYETDIKVPLVIRGPGVERNSQRAQPVLNIDLAPTIVRLAGLDPPPTMDGHPIELYAEEPPIERIMLLEYYGEGNVARVDPSCPWVYDGNQVTECFPPYDCKCQDSRNNTYTCIRHITETIDFKYCSFEDNENFEEMYDLTTDPYELTNIVNDELPAVKDWYKQVMEQMLACKGAESCDNPTLPDALLR